nr:MAG TPA: Nuclear pore complex protein [Caudoviricetes sp.]
MAKNQKSNKKNNKDFFWDALIYSAIKALRSVRHKSNGFRGFRSSGGGSNYGGYGQSGGGKPSNPKVNWTGKPSTTSTNLSSVFTNKPSSFGKSTGGGELLTLMGGSGTKKGTQIGGWGAIAFRNIVNAHSSVDEIVEHFNLDKEENDYDCDAWDRAYKEQYEIAQEIYKENVEYLLGVIDSLTADMESLIERAEELEAEADELIAEAQELREEAFENPEGAYDLISEAQDLEKQAEELKEQAQVLYTQAQELQVNIDETKIDIDALTIEENIDNDEVEKNAHTYAVEFAQTWIDGEVWIPLDACNWAYYDVSDHNL